MTPVLPAEWELQDAIMLTWPHQLTDWVTILNSVEQTYLEIVKAVITEQKLVIVAHNVDVLSHIKALFNLNCIDLNQIEFVICKTNDSWARDHGPICVFENGTLKALDFTFNGWGNKYQSELDNQINAHLFDSLLSEEAQSTPINLVLEGGAIESDGQGTLLTTSECLLNPNRNSTYSPAQLEQILSDTLGVKRFLWLENGYLEGDDTDSHIDTLARFAPNNAIVYVKCDDQSDPHFEQLTKMQQQLKQFETPQGQPYNLYALPFPKAKYNEENERLPATYANYLIINNKVLVPTYQDEHDQQALEVIAKAYPEHQVVGIDCLSLIQQFGSLHCITMQLPKGFLRSK
jgi:agmatine/peptidylarginine deiminase